MSLTAAVVPKNKHILAMAVGVGILAGIHPLLGLAAVALCMVSLRLKQLVSLEFSLMALLFSAIAIPYHVLLDMRIFVGSIPVNILDLFEGFVFIWVVLRWKEISSLKWFHWLFFASVLMSLGLAFVYGNSPYHSVREFRYILFFVLGYLGAQIVSRTNSPKFFSYAILAGALIAALNQMVEGVLSPGLRENSIIVAGVPFGLFILFAYGKELTKSSTILIGLELICIAGILLSLTRTVWLQLFLGWICLILLTDRSKKIMKSNLTLLAAAIPLGLLALAVTDLGDTIFDLLFNRAQTILNPLDGNDTVFFRLQDSLSLWYWIVDRGQIFGSGLGAFANIIITGIRGVPEFYNWDFTENSWLYYLWKMGITGFISFVIINANFFITVVRHRVLGPDEDGWKHFTLVGGSAVVGLIFSGSFSGSLSPPSQLLPVIGFFMGLAGTFFSKK